MQEAMNGGINCKDEDATENSDDTCGRCKYEIISTVQDTSLKELPFPVIQNSPNKISPIFERLVGFNLGENCVPKELKT